METISNQAHVSFSYEGSEIIKTNDSNIVNTSMKDRYSISVEKTATSTCFRPGDTITYMIHVINTGCGCLSNFNLVDNLGGDEYVSYTEGSARVFIGGSMREITPYDLSPLSFRVTDRLERDEGFILQYSVVVSDDISADVDEITNEVCVRAYPCSCNCNSERNCVNAETSLSIPKCHYAEVLITKAASNDNICCDEELDYFITLTNIGNVDATNVIVTDSLPESFTLTEIHSENNGVHYQYGEGEYTLSAENLLILPNAVGRAIYVPSIAPGVDNTTRIRIHGHM